VRSFRRPGLVGAAIIAGVTIAGCAIPTQREPSAIPASRVPFGLLHRHLPTTTTTPQNLVPVEIFLVGPNHRLVAASRAVPVQAPLKSVIDDLVAGPSPKEAKAKISTAIPGNVRVLSAKSSNNPPVATVNFNQAFGQITGSASELAVAQVVYTVVTATTPETAVAFEIEGQRISVPVAGGGQVDKPVTMSQYVANGPP
jgi:hypothetical protein